VVDQLRADAARVLAGYELPTEIRVVDALPRTPSGKVDLAAVRDLMAAPATDEES
jgi:acyl-coenzyme A synthetase/AMP-(fatty) acid ligase